jgi:recombinational DNA repair protein RecR
MYSPPFSATATISVRRLAWALGATMPKTVNRLVGLLPSLYSSALVCQRCKDKTKCSLCVFSQEISEQDKTTLLSM